MPRNTLPGIPAYERDLLRALLLRAEVGYQLPSGPELDLAERSPVFRELLRQRHLDSGMLDLAALWARAGSPADRPPAEVEPMSGGFVEDHGDTGVWADLETAVWYAHELDERITVDVALDLTC